MLQRITAKVLLTLVAAVASAAAQCAIGSTVTPTQPANISGQFVNLKEPAICSGNLTTWHFCYYGTSIDADSPDYHLFFRVWRRGQGNTYNLIANMTIRDSPNLNADNEVCVDYPLLEEQYVAVEEGDVIAVYIPFSLSTVSVLALEPAGIQELHQDTREDGTIFSSQIFRRNDLRAVNTLGLHLQADIATTVSTTTIEATTMATTNPITTPTTAPEASQSTGLPNNITEMQASATISPNNDSADGAAAAIVIVLLLVLGVAVIGLTLLVCYIKRKHGSLKGCLQRSKRKLLAIDNLIYRVGSDRIPFEVTKGKQPVVREGSTVYDIPRDKHERTLYDIPTNGTLSGHESQDYCHVKLASQSMDVTNSSQNNFSGKNGRMATLEKSDHTYIFMESSIIQRPAAEGAHGTEEHHYSQPTSDRESPDEEVYIYLHYGTVEYHKLLNQAKGGMDQEDESPFQVPPSDEEEIYVVLSEQHIKVIPKKAVEVMGELGSGHFGKVDKGVWSGSKGTLQVAIKSLNKDASQVDKVRLLQEAAIMGQFKHPNITHLHGIVTQEEEVLLILEYMPKGDLKHYLTKLRPKPNSLVPGNVPRLLVSFSQQVALGMHYLASKGFVHRDLAARNIFVSEEDICKIGDFGMSRDLSEDGSYKGQGGKVPLKWTAPEALQRRKYSIASDVWSYGCLLFEIWSLGQKPFRGIDTKKALQMIDGGYRLPPPPGCPLVIYDLMIKCWHPVAGSRPKYRDILTSLLQEEKRVLDIPVKDASSHPEACLLGVPIEAGKDMYLSLQQCYNADASDQYDPDYEYGEAD